MHRLIQISQAIISSLVRKKIIQKTKKKKEKPEKIKNEIWRIVSSQVQWVWSISHSHGSIMRGNFQKLSTPPSEIPYFNGNRSRLGHLYQFLLYICIFWNKTALFQVNQIHFKDSFVIWLVFSRTIASTKCVN